MVLTDRTEIEQVSIVSEFRQLQVKVAHVIERDGKEIARSHHYELLYPDTAIENRPEFVKAVANATWTPEIKEKWKNRPIPDRPDRLETPTATPRPDTTTR